jgi:hypothetical protein
MLEVKLIGGETCHRYKLMRELVLEESERLGVPIRMIEETEVDRSCSIVRFCRCPSFCRSARSPRAWRGWMGDGADGRKGISLACQATAGGLGDFSTARAFVFGAFSGALITAQDFG